jgi:hypothetical protein
MVDTGAPCEKGDTSSSALVTISATEMLKDGMGKEVIFYVIDVKKGGVSWQVKKRFAEFDFMRSHAKGSKVNVQQAMCYSQKRQCCGRILNLPKSKTAERS